MVSASGKNHVYSSVVLGTALSVIQSGDCIIDYIAFANTSASDISVTVQDGSGKAFVPTSPIAANQLVPVPIPDGGLLFAGGIKASAGTGAVVVMWVRVLRF